MHFFSAAQLVSFVYPLPGHAAVFKPGYYYSTAYILAQMIAQRASGVASTTSSAIASSHRST